MPNPPPSFSTIPSEFSKFKDWVWQTKGVRPSKVSELDLDTYGEYWSEYLEHKAKIDAQSKPPKNKRRPKSKQEINAYSLTSRRKFGDTFTK